MPLFRNIVTRDVTESVTIVVEAENLEKANDKLTEVAKENLDLKWALDDGNAPPDPYLGDEEATEELDPEDYKGYIIVEWDPTYYGKLHTGTSYSELVPRKLIEMEGSVAAAFQKQSFQDPVHIISYNEDELFDEKGKPLDK